MKTSKLSTLGPAIILLAAVLWGMVGLFTKYLYSVGFSPFQASMFRCFVAAIIIIPMMLIRHRSQMKLRSWKDLFFFLISGTLGLALCYSAYFITIQRSTLAIAAVMLYSAPILVAIMAAFIFKEKLTPIKIFSLICAFAGCIVMSGLLGGGSVALSVTGIAIGFLSGLGYALYNIGSRMALKYYNTYAVTAYTFVFAVIGMIPFTPVKETVGLLTANPMAILAALGMGVICTLIPYTLYVLALNYVEVGKASILSFIEPVAATVIGLLVFSEQLTTNVFVAMLLILLSVVLMNIKFKPKASPIIETVYTDDENENWITERHISTRVASRMKAKENAKAAFSELE